LHIGVFSIRILPNEIILIKNILTRNISTWNELGYPVSVKKVKVKTSRTKIGNDAIAPTCAGRVTPEADLTWLLHRAAQRMRVAMEEQAEQHGLHLRDYLVLTALGTLEQPTQLALGQAVGLDKTTLTVLLDRLEQAGLLIRRADPRDRRARLPAATEAGRVLQVKVASALARVEAGLLSGFTAAEQRSLRLMLCDLISAGESVQPRIAGSLM
jgi:DNA-binding MarR family transcriptional regulator